MVVAFFAMTTLFVFHFENQKRGKLIFNFTIMLYICGVKSNNKHVNRHLFLPVCCCFL